MNLHPKGRILNEETAIEYQKDEEIYILIEGCCCCIHSHFFFISIHNHEIFSGKEKAMAIASASVLSIILLIMAAFSFLSFFG